MLEAKLGQQVLKNGPNQTSECESISPYQTLHEAGKWVVLILPCAWAYSALHESKTHDCAVTQCRYFFTPSWARGKRGKAFLSVDSLPELAGCGSTPAAEEGRYVHDQRTRCFVHLSSSCQRSGLGGGTQEWRPCSRRPGHGRPPSVACV